MMLQGLLSDAAGVESQCHVGLPGQGKCARQTPVAVLTRTVGHGETTIAAAGVAGHASQRRWTTMLKDALQNGRSVGRCGHAVLRLLIRGVDEESRLISFDSALLANRRQPRRRLEYGGIVAAARGRRGYGGRRRSANGRWRGGSGGRMRRNVFGGGVRGRSGIPRAFIAAHVIVLSPFHVHATAPSHGIFHGQ